MPFLSSKQQLPEYFKAYLIAVVAGAGALVGDAHTEAALAALWV